MHKIDEVSEQKLRGGFYTPQAIASFVLDWALYGYTDRNLDILEPSCGDGVFLKEIGEKVSSYNRIKAIEINQTEAKKSEELNLPNLEVSKMDFHSYCNNTNDNFDLVVGNPPYIRYQFFDKEQQIHAARIFENAGLKYSKLTNSWVSFVVGSSMLLKDTGKIGFVLPAEILQVSYAKPLREFLSHFYNKINIISFSQLVFEKIQQEVVLLLCEKNLTLEHKIEHLEVDNAEALKSLNVKKLVSPKKSIDFESNKWTFYFLEQIEIDFLESLQKEDVLPKFGQLATAEVGITTGSNSFFTVPLSTVQEYKLEQFAKPLVGRSVQVSSAVFTQSDWETNRDSEARTHLLVFPAASEICNHSGAMDYIAWGEEQGINTGYKCRIRDEWQIVPSLRISDALFLRRNYIFPKLVDNLAKAYTTDTMHRVTINGNTNKKAFIASYYNSLSLAFTEICGRSHGGGVLELMPNEVEEIRIPYSPNNDNLLKTLDVQFRKQKDISEILEISNQKILVNEFGFSKADVNIADGIWKKLVNRRMKRSKKNILT